MIELKSQIRPVLNSNFYPLNYGSQAAPTQTPRGYDIKELMWWIKRTPECIGIGRRIAMDIVSKISFKAVDKKLTGRPKKDYSQKSEDDAIAFGINENLREKLVSAVLDWVFTGDAYIWHNFKDKEKVKELTAPLINRLEKKDSKLKKLDDDFSALSTLELIPSTTTEIRHNGQKVIYYVQNVFGNERKYLPESVIHARFMHLDGDIYGFTPMRASGGIIQSLGFIKDYSRNYFNNGGIPDMIFKMTKEMAGSPNHEALKQTLQKYKGMKNKHGNLVVTGELETEELNRWNKDMEFRQYAIYLTGCLAFAFNMPADIISSILGVDIKGTAMGSDIEDAGYNRNISHSQDYWENLLNSQLFNEYFGVDISFEREYKQDEIRLAQHRAMNVPLAEFMFKHDYPVSDEFFHNILQIPRKYIEKGKIKREVEEPQPAISGANKPIVGPNQKKLQDQKRAQQKPQSSNNPPVGA